jgi:hypothetical protein
LIEPLIGLRWRLLCPKPQLLREQTAHLLAALHSEGIKALAAQSQQLFALGVAQLLAAHQVVGALVVAGDAGEHLAHHPLHPFGGVAIWVTSSPRIRRTLAQTELLCTAWV